MSQVKVRELRNLSQAELVLKKEALHKELFDLRQKKLTGQLDKPHLFQAARKQIAQICTLLNEAENKPKLETAKNDKRG